MITNERRLQRNIMKNQLLDSELDFLPATISRDDIRELARTHDPQRRGPISVRIIAGTTDFIARYSAPFLGMVAGAEYRAAKALYPFVGEEARYGDSLRLFLGENIGKRIDDTGKAFEVTDALISATPNIVGAALYGAAMGIAAYYLVKWTVLLGASFWRITKLRRRICDLLEYR